MGDIEGYWRDAFPKIEGWVDDRLLEYVKLLNETQLNLGVAGHVAEIGVFHGKFLIALAHLAQRGGKVTAIDVFDDQDRNIDGAGVGSLGTLRSNIEDFGPKDDIDYHFLKTDSTVLTLADKVKLTQERGTFRLFSVDGCHTAEHTFSDLLTAQDCLSPGGVIILDDVFHPHWPGVTEAVSLFIGRQPARVKPFLYCCHKLFFVGHGWHADFLRAFTARLGGRADAKMTMMAGTPVLSIFP